MPKFRKRPVVVEAFQITRLTRWENVDWPEWLNRAWNKDRHEVGAVMTDEKDPAHPWLWVNTIEGKMQIVFGSWIIKGIVGELYACREDIFEKTYEPIND
jgi:hypothetical protein